MENESDTILKTFVVALFSSLTIYFIFALVHEVAFYNELGTSITLWPVNVSDIIMSSLSIIAVLGATFLTYLFTELCFSKIIEKKGDSGSVYKSKAGMFIVKFMILIFLISVMFYVLFGGRFNMIMFFTFALAIVPFAVMFGPRNIGNKKKYIIMLQFSLLLISLSYFTGVTEADQVKKYLGSQIEIQFKNEKVVKRYVIRFLEKGVIVYDNNISKLEFIFYSDISSIVQKTNYRPFTGYFNDIKWWFSAFYHNELKLKTYSISNKTSVVFTNSSQ
ncbi:hypothetical protein [Maridesulfovibrio frigidus]|uniref:hypothetical protein n=1 Tax=Maridesulfovibrio frigidus TaxID=340956 RepID=UPI0004E19DB7|nr:hypothetical protein [Maridesulfovibrio frigidus]